MPPGAIRHCLVKPSAMGSLALMTSQGAGRLMRTTAVVGSSVVGNAPMMLSSARRRGSGPPVPRVGGFTLLRCADGHMSRQLMLSDCFSCHLKR